MNSTIGPPSPKTYSQRFNSQDDDVVINISRYFGLFLSNWYWFVVALFVSGLLAYYINTYTEKVYTVSSSLLIKDDQGTARTTGLDQMMPGSDFFNSQQNLQNEIGILKSFSLNFRVIQDMPDFQYTTVMFGRRGIAQIRLYKNSPFIVVFDSVKAEHTGVPLSIQIRPDDTYTLEINGRGQGKKTLSFGEKFKESGFDFTLMKKNPGEKVYNPNISNRYILWFNSPEGLANSYRGKLGISPMEQDASLVALSVSGAVPTQEAEYLNKLMEEYIQQGLDFKNQTAENTIKFIEQQLGLISDSLALAENKLEDFRLANKLIDLSSEGSAIKTKLENYNQEKIAASLEKQYYEYLSEYIKTRNESGEIVSPSVMGVTDQLLIKLVDEFANLQIQKKQLKYNFSGNQPAIALIDSKIEDARNSLDENVRNSIVNVSRTLSDIEFRISGVEKEMNKLPGTERKLINIQRKFDLNNTVYTYMLEKRSEAGIAKASNVSGNRIIDRAEPFNSVMIKPKARRNYLIALLFSLLIPGLYIFFIDQFHNKILDKGDIEKGTQVPVIGFVGHNTSKNEIPVFSKPGSSLAESFRSIRTNLKYYLNGEKKGVISVTSTLTGEGKTFVSLNLAAALAMLGKKTLLIGLDLRKPRINKLLSSNVENGLTAYLVGEKTYNEIIDKTEVNNLFFVPSGPVPPNPSELIDSEKMKQFMKTAGEEFDFIVLDTPPVGIVSDALLLGAYADINIFVVRQKYTFKRTLQLIEDIFEKRELKNLTIAVNDINISGYYGYGLRYGYGFYQGYGYNYGYGQYGGYAHGDYHKYYKEE